MSEDGGNDISAIQNLAQGQDRIEAALIKLTDSVNKKFDELGQRFVPRSELDSKFMNIAEHQSQQDNRLTALELGRETDRSAIGIRLDRVEEKHRADRVNAIFVALSLFGLALTALTLIITHWK
jgi:hypothetical protein